MPMAVVSLGRAGWRRSKGRQTPASLYHPLNHVAHLSSPTFHQQHQLVDSNGDAGSITRGAGHSGPCSPTERTAWHQDRSLEVHPHVFGPQVFIFATGSSSYSSIIYTTTVLPNEDRRRSILRLTHRTCPGWSDIDASLLPQCRTTRKIQCPLHSTNVLDAGEAGGRPSVWCLSPPEGAGFHPSFRLPGRIGNSTELPLFPPPLPKPR